MKRIFYLKPATTFIQSFDEPDEVICWVYKFGEDRMFSNALQELIENFYFEN